jgi:protein TonB
MSRSPLGLTLFALAGSFALHGAAYAALPPSSIAELALGPSEVTVQIPPPRPPAPRAPEPEAPKPEPAPAPPPKAPPALSPPPAVVPAPAPAPEPTGLAGVTLEGEGEGGFAAPAGDGTSLDPSRFAPAPAPPAAVEKPPPAPRAPALVAAAKLSSRPQPPPLDAALRRHYPAQARRQGVGGSASVRARIEPDGRVLKVSVIVESFAGFGEACRRTLAGSRWSAPRDREGRAVATEIRYTCRFVVAR